MKWGKKSVEETLKELDTSKQGLNNTEVQKRIQKYGLNELVEEKKDGPVKKFLMQFMDILIILLLLAAVAAYFVGDAIDAVVILLVVILNATVGFIQENKAEKAMEN